MPARAELGNAPLGGAAVVTLPGPAFVPTVAAVVPLALVVDGVAIIGPEDLDVLLGGPQVLSGAQVEYIAGAVRRRLRPA